MNTIENAITAITLRGFKSIGDEQRMEIRPLTVLAGANSSGKSSFMQPLLLLKQTLESPFDSGVFLLNGPNVRFTSADQLLTKGQGGVSAKTFSIMFEMKSQDKLRLTYRKVEGKGFDIECMEFVDAREPGPFRRYAPNLTHDEILAALPNFASYLNKLMEHISGQIASHRWIVKRDRCFLTLMLESVNNPEERLVFTETAPTRTTAMLVPEIKGIIHVPGLRGNPERNYAKTSSVGPNFPGTFENYVASVISQWQASKSPKLKELGEALEHLGLTWKVEAKSLDDTQVELKVGRLAHGKKGGAHDMVSIADVGFGVSQTLPVLVALLAAQPGQMVYVEQPEIHLHPFAQRRLAYVLAAAAHRNVRVIMETHSALLLREIQTIVAKGELDANLVKLHCFKRNPLNGATELSSADLDENGAFGEKWPEDFDENHLDAQMAYLNAVEEKASQP